MADEAKAVVSDGRLSFRDGWQYYFGYLRLSPRARLGFVLAGAATFIVGLVIGAGVVVAALLLFKFGEFGS